ncbi:MAG: hypothetical protein EOM26_04385 [Alphaproteobacteria bacterium]|nr:hypothetical protein [Alphaproteobacteria bacterium]
MNPLENTILYLIGFPGTGKYTIAKEICRQRPEFRLVDNHLINNPIFSVIAADGKSKLPERVWDNAGQIWRAVFDSMIHISPPGFSFVLTNYLSQRNPDDVAWFAEVEAMAAARGAVFVPVLLTIDPVEHVRRITQPGRKERFKCIDGDAPHRYAREDRLVDVRHQNLLMLDVTSLSAEDTAGKIIWHAKRQTASRS